MRIGRAIIIPAIVALGVAGSILPGSAMSTVSAAQVTPSLVLATSPSLTSLLGMTMLAIVITVVMAVICTAVWSGKKTRRDAALAVLDRIFGRQPER